MANVFAPVELIEVWEILLYLETFWQSTEVGAIKS
jgi:hypothetical protein